MTAVLKFVAKYWLEFLLVTISTGLSVACKKIYALYKDAKSTEKTKEQDAFYTKIENLIKDNAKESRREDKKLQDQINVMQEGILSIQGRSFKQSCREMLEPEEEFTLEEFETLQDEYYVYKNLGGNHDGDVLFELVKKKATNILTDNK